MQVSDILRVKGNTLFTLDPDSSLSEAVRIMAENDLGSLIIMDRGHLAGVLTFREIIQALNQQGGALGTATVRDAMASEPMTCAPSTDLDEVRRLMLECHARYLPVMDGTMLMGVISFYDVAKAVVDAQNFENKMLKAYIRDWPTDTEAGAAGQA
jgi:CBS domain-containing protein